MQLTLWAESVPVVQCMEMGREVSAPCQGTQQPSGPLAQPSPTLTPTLSQPLGLQGKGLRRKPSSSQVERRCRGCPGLVLPLAANNHHCLSPSGGTRVNTGRRKVVGHVPSRC